MVSRIVVGADVHKRTHTFVVVDEVGRELGSKTVAAVTDGHRSAVTWVQQEFGSGAGAGVVWAIEDCRHLSARLERDLLSAGQQVVRVPPKMMAEQRRTARTRGKSDPIDAAAVARAALRDPGLPVASHDEQSRQVKLLVDRRDDLVKHRTATINRLLWRIHELDPAAAPKPGGLDLAKHQRLLAGWLDTQIQDRSRSDSPVAALIAELARDELADVVELTGRINQLEDRLAGLVAQAAPTLLAMPGVATLTAAKIVGETAGIGRFKSEAAFARHTGIAPIPVWSDSSAGRVRLCRAGNRQLNAAITRIAITQIRLDGLSKTYYQKKKAEGMTNREALRCLKRRLTRIVYQHLIADQTPTTATITAA